MLTEGTPCKIGTHPSVVRLHLRDAKLMQVGWSVRIQESRGDKWHRVYVTSFKRNKAGVVIHFTADR